MKCEIFIVTIESVYLYLFKDPHRGPIDYLQIFPDNIFISIIKPWSGKK